MTVAGLNVLDAASHNPRALKAQGDDERGVPCVDGCARGRSLVGVEKNGAWQGASQCRWEEVLGGCEHGSQVVKAHRNKGSGVMTRGDKPGFGGARRDRLLGGAMMVLKL